MLRACRNISPRNHFPGEGIPDVGDGLSSLVEELNLEPVAHAACRTASIFVKMILDPWRFSPHTEGK